MVTRIAILLLVALGAHGQLSMTSPFFSAATIRVTASTPSITVDYWQDFEFGNDGDNPTALQLEAAHAPYTNDWTLNGSTTLLYVRTAGQSAWTTALNGITDSGTRGLEIDINAGNTASRAIYILLNKGASPVSWGLKLKANSLVSSVNAVHILFSVANVGGTGQTRVLMGTDASGNFLLKLDNLSTSGSTITLTPDSWYHVTCKSEKSATSTLQVFDSDGGSIGTSSVTAAANDAYYFIIGDFNAYLEIGSIFIDNLGIDVTDATFPLGP